MLHSFLFYSNLAIWQNHNLTTKLITTIQIHHHIILYAGLGLRERLYLRCLAPTVGVTDGGTMLGKVAIPVLKAIRGKLVAHLRSFEVACYQLRSNSHCITAVRKGSSTCEEQVEEVIKERRE